MKFKIYSEDFKDGIEVDWPAIPSEGEFVYIRYPGGTTTQRVCRVEYHADKELALTEINVHLKY
ncbi:hypothetical protein [Hoeflea sp.]|uniref:hypothetical protein n=1 Tax=Hoeflea sp. TaxID=1940281 RepID=UPI003A94B0E4